MKLRIAFIVIIVAIFSHLYLTNHYYQLSFGLADEGSVCNINKVFSCDTVSASKYSSLLGIPMAAWGAATNFVLFVLIIGWMIRWGDDIARLAAYATYLSGVTALASIVMASISTLVLRTYCLFCIVTYICSFVVFELLRRSRPDDSRTLKDHLTALLGPAKIYVALLIAIPSGALLLDRGILNNYGAKNLQEFVSNSIADWKTSPKVEITAPALVKGASDETAKFVISEFADFRCGHCKSASSPLAAFVASRTDVQLRFYNFPLDSACNPNVEFGDGISCLLARGIMCAEKLTQKGWDLHDEFFANQEKVARMNIDAVKNKISEWGISQGLEAATMTSCLDDEATRKIVSEQSQAGKTAGVKGTPTILVNGQKLPRGQSLPVLEKAYQITTSK